MVIKAASQLFAVVKIIFYIRAVKIVALLPGTWKHVHKLQNGKLAMKNHQALFI